MKKNVIITADSTCDLSKETVEKRNIVITPLTILLGDESHVDGVDIQPDDIYEYVEKYGILPKTSAITPIQYNDVFKKYTDMDCEIVHIGLSSAISSSYQNAKMVAESFDGVYTVDSKSLCSGMGLLVLKACDMRDEGMSAAEIAEKLKEYQKKISCTFVIDTLQYLYHGGRCSRLTMFGANVLNIKPSIAVNNETGELAVSKKYKGKTESVYMQYAEHVMENVENMDKKRIFIGHSGVSQEIIQKIYDLVKSKADFEEILVIRAGCTISSHCGPGTLTIMYMEK